MSPQINSRHRFRGFTLLEILVAVAVFAMFSVLAYGGLMQLLDSQQHLNRERAYWHHLARGMQRIADDLAHARARSVRDIDGTILPAFIGRPTDTRALAPPVMEFTRGGLYVLNDATRADIQRVAYRVVDGQLLRLTWPVLDRSPTTKPYETVVFEGVDEFKVRFYGNTNNWVEQWPAGNTADVPPRGVEITLTLHSRGTYRRILLVNG